MRHNRTGVYLQSVTGMAVAVAVLVVSRSHLNQTTIALALLLVVLFTATLRGSRPALVNSVLGMLCFNFFFLPPYHTLIIADPQNWVALAAFLITAITAGQLSARAKRRAEEAERGKLEVERLYQELQDAFARASHTEALRQSEKLKSALLDAVTHDLRTPLTSIKASISTLLDEVRETNDGERRLTLDDESRLEMLLVINEESDRLNRFIGGLIELARIEAGEMHLRRRWGVVEEIIAEALARAAPLTREHLVEARIEDELPLVRVDPRAVSEVVYTLVDNAAKYSPPGMRLRITAGRASGDMLQIAVEDEGPGIAPHLRERVFDKFYRATRDGDISTHQPAGTGMGLAIAKGIVEAHDGQILIEEGAEGWGTRVVFRLPIGDDEEPSSETTREEIVMPIDGPGEN